MKTHKKIWKNIYQDLNKVKNKFVNGSSDFA